MPFEEGQTGDVTTGVPEMVLLAEIVVVGVVEVLKTVLDVLKAVDKLIILVVELTELEDP